MQDCQGCKGYSLLPRIVTLWSVDTLEFGSEGQRGEKGKGPDLHKLHRPYNSGISFKLNMADYASQFNMTPDQKVLFDQFKTEMKIPLDAPLDGIQDDITVYRFLSAKKWDYQVALDQYKAMLEYRKRDDVDNIDKWIKENPEKVNLIQSLFPLNHRGYDKDGRPLIYESVGTIPAGRFAKLVTVKDNHKYHVYFMEKLMLACRKQTKKLAKPIYQATMIVDLAGTRAEARHLVPFLKDMSAMDEQNYPELAHAIFIVNAPWIFPAMYNLIKPFIDPNTRRKIHVHSTGFEKELLETVDAKVLNVHYGGENKEELPMVHPIEIRKCSKDKTAKEVKKGETLEIVEHCEDKKGGRFCWCFEGDTVDFSAEYIGLKAKKSEIACGRSICKEHHGEYFAKGPGKLILKFRNSSTEQVLRVRYALFYYSHALLKTNEIIEAKAKKHF
ncbi:hypothetical protein AAMO2058_001026000 [Amorphochlora amoebiformis]